MKQVLNSKGNIIVEEVPTPTVEAGRILVKTAYSCISTGTELSGLRASATPIWRKALDKPQHVKKVLEIAKEKGISGALDAIDSKLGTPKSLGYSLSGEVVAVGDGVIGFKTGDLVACAGAQCANHAEYASVPVNLAVHIPSGAAQKESSMVALGAIALQGVRRLEPTLGETFLVVGLGVLGQLSVQILKAAGCRVIGADLNSQRIDVAMKLGMDLALTSDEPNSSQVAKLTGGIGVDGVLITASGGSPDIISQAFKACRKKGRVVLVGDVPLQIDRNDIYEKELDFRVSTSYGPGRYDNSFEEIGVDYPLPYVRWTETRNMAAFLEMIARGTVKAETLIEGIFAVEKAPEAFALLKEKQPMVCLLEYKNANPVEQKSITVQSLTTSKEVRLSLIGAGSFAENVHLPNLKKLTHLASLESVVCRSGHKAKNLASRFQAHKAETSWEQVLSDSNTNAVLISTRHNQHSNIALSALKKGKHVLVEKPLALTESELSSLEEYFSHAKSAPILMTGFNRRFSPGAQKAKQYLANRKGPVIIQYRMNAGFIPTDHWVHGAEGGGRNIGEACHIYDLFIYLIGCNEIKSTNVTSLGSNKDPYRSNDNFVASFTFADGSMASLLYTSMGNAGMPKEYMNVFFDGKILELDDYKSLNYIPAPGKNEQIKTDSKGHLEELNAFFHGIKNGISPISLADQFAATRMSFAVEQKLQNN